MEYRNLGRTGIKVSPLCLGAMNFGRATEEADSIRIIDRAIDEGINFVDTANVYTRGVSETITGKALKGKRDKVVLATKVFGKMDDDDPNAWGGTRRHIIEQCHASLERLQTDYIDLYQIHRPSSDYPIDETLRALDDLIRDGKVRYIGVSTFSAWQIVESLWVSKEYGLNRFICEQPPYNLLDRRAEVELLPMAQTYGIGIIPWSPLASGRLTGKYKRGQDAPEGSRMAGVIKQGQGTLDDFFSDAIYDVIEGVEALAQAQEVPVSQYALAWVTQQAGVTSPIIGPRTMQQLEDALASLNITISEDDQAKIDELIPPGTFVRDFYSGADFGPSKYHW
ncbi:MAG: aldo/keto reductase [Chloroflexi bacterium]|nr:MAG: aldo/keto reductase [Chloroflexota bacterium]MBL1193225.1 aldo/keto reductase [Chloroflexota bacterium]NOH10520.1 aldo/keto reductase [Chloroflexota bacterium]